ncbi:hypothetical protein, variant [Capsaspora owczarzaki ATCC 30864]|nr:hypothetical protein, variant [Capsaspora owczarzaki ATCC 30864]
MFWAMSAVILLSTLLGLCSRVMLAATVVTGVVACSGPIYQFIVCLIADDTTLIGRVCVACTSGEADWENAQNQWYCTKGWVYCLYAGSIMVVLSQVALVVLSCMPYVAPEAHRRARAHLAMRRLQNSEETTAIPEFDNDPLLAQPSLPEQEQQQQHHYGYHREQRLGASGAAGSEWQPPSQNYGYVAGRWDHDDAPPAYEYAVSRDQVPLMRFEPLPPTNRRKDDVTLDSDPEVLDELLQQLAQTAAASNASAEYDAHVFNSPSGGAFTGALPNQPR